MTGIHSKERILNDIIYLCQRAKEPRFKKLYNMKQLEQLYIDTQLMVRTKKMAGL